jgi:uncharacterized protein (TIGR03067 family)
MWRRILCVVVACFGTVVIGMADDKSTDEAKALQGTWQAVDLEANGQKSSPDQVRELQVVIEGDEIYAVKPQGADPRNKFKLDTSKTPRAIDVIPLEGARKGEVVPGIYSLQDGRLRLCINLFGSNPPQRPTEFKTQDGDGVVFATLERAKAK